MPTSIEASTATELALADYRPRGPVHPSPLDWRDQVLYFLLPDRFSDGQEAQRPLYDRAHPDTFRAPDKRLWMSAGKRFQGGTLNGIATRLDYLQQLGVTTLWIGPVWRQRSELDTYHGYGIQNFLDVDPRFGTRHDLRRLIDAAHERGMYVLLDIIYNHTGNNWFYDVDGSAQETAAYRYSPPYRLHGWRSGAGQSVRDIHTQDDGVWPREFQNPDWYTRAGQIGRWDADSWEDPQHPSTEFRRGDFFELKDLDHSRPEVLSAVIQVYQYWIALSDCDGFRIDTVKHVSWETSRNFCGAIREYAESIGKHNFWLLGEVTGGEAFARNYLDIFGRNLDAVLDVGLPAVRLIDMVKGQSDPLTFFVQFQGHNILGSHRETGRYHVSILDDHDMVGREKHRFTSHNSLPSRDQQVAHAVGTQLTTLGVPCIYYGTEQAFDGTQDRHDFMVEAQLSFEDRYIRETMFGGSFGAFETAGCHFFDASHPAYLRIAAIARLRNQEDVIGLTLRRGRQYLRETSFLGRPFEYPRAGELVAWSRLLYQQEVVVALNTHAAEPRGAYVTVDRSLHPPQSQMKVLYQSGWSDAELHDPPSDRIVPVVTVDGRATVRIDLPPAGMVILA
jgi:glycosidase